MNVDNVLALIGLILLVAMIFQSHLLFRAFYPKKKDRHSLIQSLVMDAVFLAIILVMTFVPNMGFLMVFPMVTLTLLHLPVLLGAALGGWKKGLLYGVFFGVASWIKAMTAASGAFDLLFIYPWCAVLPRALFGMIAGFAFAFLDKVSHKGKKVLYLTTVSVLATLLHTGLVFLDLYIFFPKEITAFFQYAEAGWTFSMIIGFGALGEAILAGVVIPALYMAANAALPGYGKSRKKALR